MNGIINIYKEKGFTSFDVVAKMRGILKQRKIGHTGTLDPEAEGVLPVCLGNGTKLCDMLTDRTKQYRVVMRLGVQTDTEDMTGNILCKQEVKCNDNDVADVIMSFVGEYDQIPPMYSALKVNGKKLYELAREGKTIERHARRITIISITIETIDLPLVTMIVDCSKGTYIRSLCRDIGEKLGCGGCMDSLIRTRSGEFTIDKSIRLDELEKIVLNNSLDSVIIPVDAVFKDYVALLIGKLYDKYVYNGNKIPLQAAEDQYDFTAEDKGTRFRIYDSNNKFIGIYETDEQMEYLVPVKIFGLGEQ